MQMNLTLETSVVVRLAQTEIELAGLSLDAGFKMKENWNRLLKLAGFLEGLLWLFPALKQEQEIAETIVAVTELQQRYRNSATWAAAPANGAAANLAKKHAMPAAPAPDNSFHPKHRDGRGTWVRVHRTDFAPASKLDEKQVLEIYDLAWSGDTGVSEIAKAYGLSSAHVFSIRARKSWKHLLDKERPAGALPPDRKPSAQ